LNQKEKPLDPGRTPVASESSVPTILVNHDGELVDVLALLSECGLQAVDRRGAPTHHDFRMAWELVIATPKRIVKLEETATSQSPVRVVIVDEDSRTLRAMLQRFAIDFVVRRPVLPAALRLLVLHSLYRGTEKRGGGRVSIGAQVRFRSGLRKRSAQLVDLSQRGCRLLSFHAVPQGGKLMLQLPAELGGRRSLSIKGRVKRSRPAEAEGEGMFALGVIFEEIGTVARAGLRTILEAHSKGPAIFHGGRATHDDRAPAPNGSTETLGGERRTDPRRPYGQRVIALADDATRVLLGRDISFGGMRVDRNPEFGLGDRLRIAIHVGARTEPLVVDSRVTRDDGEEGLVLEFENLSDQAHEYLKKMVSFLPILAAGDDGGEGVIVSELLERKSA
jgi:hypothetical protein